MRMMKNNNNETVMVIGIDHGYGNMKTATRCFPSGVARYDKEPIFQNRVENMAWWVSVQWWGDDRQVSQSGKPLCTGASLWAVPKLARGLCPLEPWHVNGVSNPAKCPPDIPTEHLLID